MATGSIASSQTSSVKAASTDHEKLARSVYAELVNTNTMDTVGSTTRPARLIAKRFLDAGFPPEDVKILVPPGDSTKGNLIVRYHGTGARKPLLLLAHIDVVAALRSDWSRDPFELQEDNGFFYGRGSSDDKAMASIFVANLLQYKAEGWKPDRDLILALTAAEEGGDNNGAEWLAQCTSRSSMLRTTCVTTCVTTKLAGGHANKALPQTATANVNCRIVPTSSIAETQAMLAKVFADTSVKITTREREKFSTSTSAIAPELLVAATGLTQSKWGSIPVVPVMFTGATDGRYLRAVGIPTYGVSGIFSLPGETNAHGRDEKLRKKSFNDGLDFLDKLVRQLAGGAQ